MANVSPAVDGIAIALRGVHKHYGRLHAVDGVDMDIRQGEIIGLIGHNGAGKSTLFKLMLGLEPPCAGSIHIAGRPIGGPGFRALRQQLGYLPENVVLYDSLDGLETLRFFARLKGVPADDCPAMLARVGLQQAGRRPVREYSKGMRQRLGFAQALLGQPRVLFLDEPTNGLDPQAIRDFHAELQALKAAGVTIVITSHVLAELQERVDRLAILASGELRALGSVEALREHTGLPLVVEIDLPAAHREEAARVLQQASGSPPEPAPAGLRLKCPRGRKMALLGALAPLGASDVRLHEPSLEDMFLGLSD